MPRKCVFPDDFKRTVVIVITASTETDRPEQTVQTKFRGCQMASDHGLQGLTFVQQFLEILIGIMA